MVTTKFSLVRGATVLVNVRKHLGCRFVRVRSVAPIWCSMRPVDASLLVIDSCSENRRTLTDDIEVTDGVPTILKTAARFTSAEAGSELRAVGGVPDAASHDFESRRCGWSG